MTDISEKQVLSTLNKTSLVNIEQEFKQEES